MIHMFARVAATLMLACLLANCATSPVRESFNLDEISTAQIPGMTDVRYWADQAGPALAAAYQQRAAQERLARGAEALKKPAYMLALSGGGDDGAFGAGLLNGWSKRGDRPEFTLVTGVSTGALIAPLAFAGPAYDEALRRAFTEIDASDVYENLGLVGLLEGDALTSSGPLRHLVATFTDEALLLKIAAEHRKGRRLLVGTTNLDTQRPVMWDLGAIASSDNPNRLKLFRDVIIASAAVPGVFPPVLIETEAEGKNIQELHVDGGVTMNVLGLPRNFSLVQQANRAHVKRKATTYVVYNGRIAPDFSVIPIHTLPIAKRSISTLLKSHGHSVVVEMYEYARRNGVDFNLASIGTDFGITSTKPFDRAYMNKLFDYGFELAQAGYPWVKRPN